MDILLCFQRGRPMKLHDIHAATGLNKSRILRTAGTLMKYGFLKQDPASKAYALGPVFFSLAGTLAPALDRAKRAAQPILDALTAELGQTTMLSNAIGDERVVIVRAEPEHGLRYGVSVGQRRSLFHGATGTVLIAGSGLAIDSARNWNTIRERAEYTYADPADFDAAIERARRDGYALSRRGNAFALAVPVVLAGETAALTVVGPQSEMNDDMRDTLRKRLADASERLRDAVDLWSEGINT